jgi:hypothetical protein
MRGPGDLEREKFHPQTLIEVMLNSPLKINQLGAEMSVWKVIARALSVVLLTAFVRVGGAALFNAVKRDTLKLRLDSCCSKEGHALNSAGCHFVGVYSMRDSFRLRNGRECQE